MTDEPFVRVYDRVVRRYWANPTVPLSEGEFADIVNTEGLTYPHLQGRPMPTAAVEPCPVNASFNQLGDLEVDAEGLGAHRFTDDTSDGILRCVKCGRRKV